jgi:hypothetical protein
LVRNCVGRKSKRTPKPLSHAIVGPACAANISMSVGSFRLAARAMLPWCSRLPAASSTISGSIEPLPFSARCVSKSSVTSVSLFMRR